MQDHKVLNPVVNGIIASEECKITEKLLRFGCLKPVLHLAVSELRAKKQKVNVIGW
jgi:hypothetical protein